MAIATAELETLRDALIRARARGVRKLEIDENTAVTYGSDREMAAAIADLDRRIAAASGRPPNRINISASKGL